MSGANEDQSGPEVLRTGATWRETQQRASKQSRTRVTENRRGRGRKRPSTDSGVARSGEAKPRRSPKRPSSGTGGEPSAHLNMESHPSTHAPTQTKLKACTPSVTQPINHNKQSINRSSKHPNREASRQPNKRRGKQPIN